MRFSSNGYYIESYDKCSVCGKLIYEGDEVKPSDDVIDESKMYCSEWCIEWEKSRQKTS